jgi:hypothetical protein
MRALLERERPLVTAIFEAAGLEIPNLLRVRDMSDGGRGSLLFQPGSAISLFGLAKLYFVDDDGVLVTASLNATAENKPVELDITKMDSSPLRRWPKEGEILRFRRM